MRIKSIHLKQFKRFTDLKISDLPETTKLVVMIGPNGCGKSCVFDALHAKAVVRHYWGWQEEHMTYWNKQDSLNHENKPSNFDDDEKIKIDFHGASPTDSESWKKAVYARSAYRNDPSERIQQLHRVGPAVDEHRFVRLIENDEAVTLNYQRLASDGFEDAYERCDEGMTLKELRRQLLGDIRDAVGRLFQDPLLHLNGLANPLRDGNFRFTKGDAERFLYENLSGGEKAAFDLILDLVVKSREYNDTVYCIDEPEAHLNLRLQAKLLRELYRLIPEDCQLWIATHSVGMMRAAYELEESNPGKVIFLDFGQRDFDRPQAIRPLSINRKVWEQMHRVVLEDLAALIAPRRIILCEGKPGEQGLDARCYNTIFGDEFPDTLFVSTGGKGQGENYSTVIKAIVEAEVILLRDKDNLSPRGVEEEKNTGKLILSRAKIEDYLLDDEVLRALCDMHAGVAVSKFNEVKLLKENKLQERNSNMKAIVNDLRNWTINSLGVHDAGDNSASFLEDTLAPLIKPGMKVYEELRGDIFGPGSTTRPQVAD